MRVLALALPSLVGRLGAPCVGMHGIACVALVLLGWSRGLCDALVLLGVGVGMPAHTWVACTSLGGSPLGVGCGPCVGCGMLVVVGLVLVVGCLRWGALRW